MITGSAPIDPQVLDFLKICFSCPVYEGYGLTETSAAVSCTQINDPLAGHVGGPLACVKVRLMDVPEMSYTSQDKPYPRGELCVKGSSVTCGYYKRPDKTAEAFDAQGYFKTGDIALIYPNGTIKIIDRSKNIFKLSQGEYIAPEKVENMLALSPIIAQSMVYGDSLRSCVVAIIVPHLDKIEAWSKENGLDQKPSETIKEPVFKKLVMDEVTRICTEQKLTGLEKPKDIFITLEMFSVDNNLLTPTFKLKRNVARDYFKPQIDTMYAALIKQGL